MTTKRSNRDGIFSQCSRVFTACLLAGAGFWLAGCQSLNGPGSSSTASVTIENRAFAEIAGATQAVFRKQGFQGGRTGPLQMTFTAPGTKMDKLAYGDLLEGNVTVQAVVNFQQLAPGSILVTCNAQYLENPGDAILQDSHKIRSIGGSRYKKMLDEVKTQLK